MAARLSSEVGCHQLAAARPQRSLSDKTVRHYLDKARRKLNASKINHAVSTAILNKIICDPGKICRAA
jgi:hypothetical protein